MKKSSSTKGASSVATKESQAEALHYMKTLVDVARESFLILDAELRVISTNEVFLTNFQVTAKETEGVMLMDLGNGQWDIPELKVLLKEVLPKKKDVRNYEVTHNFESIGTKTILLNAKQIDSVQLIILALEDISVRKELENTVAANVAQLEDKVRERTAELASRVSELESMNKTMVGRELRMIELKKEIEDLKKKSNQNETASP